MMADVNIEKGIYKCKFCKKVVTMNANLEEQRSQDLPGADPLCSQAAHAVANGHARAPQTALLPPAVLCLNFRY